MELLHEPNMIQVQRLTHIEHLTDFLLPQNLLKIESGSPGGPGIGVSGSVLKGRREGKYFDCKIQQMRESSNGNDEHWVRV